MPDPITATIAMTAAVALRPARRAGPAMSEEGQFAKARATQVWNRFEVSFQPIQSGLIAELDTLAVEHSLPGWDGDEAPPVSYAALENARSFIHAFPAALVAPELAVDPDDGAISFEWHGGYRRVFSVSVGESDRVSCAGLDGTDQWHAVLRFDGGISPFVIESIRRVTA